MVKKDRQWDNAEASDKAAFKVTGEVSGAGEAKAQPDTNIDYYCRREHGLLLELLVLGSVRCNYCAYSIII